MELVKPVSLIQEYIEMEENVSMILVQVDRYLPLMALVKIVAPIPEYHQIKKLAFLLLAACEKRNQLRVPAWNVQDILEYH